MSRPHRVPDDVFQAQWAKVQDKRIARRIAEEKRRFVSCYVTYADLASLAQTEYIHIYKCGKREPSDIDEEVRLREIERILRIVRGVCLCGNCENTRFSDSEPESESDEEAPEPEEEAPEPEEEKQAEPEPEPCDDDFVFIEL